MLAARDILFIHVPKTAGESLTKFLIDHIPGPFLLTDGPDRPDPSAPLPLRVRAKLAARRVLARLGPVYPRSVTRIENKRHERLGEAAEFLAARGRRLDDFLAILAVVRNPYDLEVSRYHYLRRGHRGVKGLARGREQAMAMAENFESFALRAPLLGRARIEEWYEIAGSRPQNLRILRFETLAEDLSAVLAPLYGTQVKLPRLNATPHAPYTAYLTPAAEAAIYGKYRWLFDEGFYARENGPAAGEPVRDADT